MEQDFIRDIHYFAERSNWDSLLILRLILVFVRYSAKTWGVHRIHCRDVIFILYMLCYGDYYRWKHLLISTTHTIVTQINCYENTNTDSILNIPRASNFER